MPPMMGMNCKHVLIQDIGEGQHELVPRRHDPIGANATLQYSVITSTALAAAYASFASRYHQRVTPLQTISKTALFIRSSARLGIWASVAGAAVNCYYHTAFTNVALQYVLPNEVKKWELYEWTKSHTVEDGALAGAGLGLAASIPMLFMWRPDIPRWTRCLGMANIGACTGILGTHAYFQHTGDRQAAYTCLETRLKRRSLHFLHIHKNKEFMAKLAPVMQYYVRHNAVWYTQLLPEEAFEQPDVYVKCNVQSDTRIPKAEASTEEQAKQQPFYPPPRDYAKELRDLSQEKTLAAIAKLEARRNKFLEEAEYLLFINAQQQYEYCHADAMDDDERQRRLREIDLLAKAYDYSSASAHLIDIKLTHWRLALQHNAALISPAAGGDLVTNWLPKSKSKLINISTYKPKLSIQAMEDKHATTAAEVKKHEECAAWPGLTQAERDKCRKDAEDGRVLMRALDHIIFEFEKAQKALELGDRAVAAIADDKNEQKSEEGVSVSAKVPEDSAAAASAADKSGQKSEEDASVSAKAAGLLFHHLQATTNAMVPQVEAMPEEEKQQNSQVEQEDSEKEASET
jgi:hypothetical protein